MRNSTWVHISAVTSSLCLTVFSMVQITVVLALNLRADQWDDRLSVTNKEQTTTVTGILLVEDSLVIFPAAVVGICAAVSRSVKVYIVLLVLSALALLTSISGLIVMSYIFSTNELFYDAGSINDELAISLMVFQPLMIIAILFLSIFAIVGISKHMGGSGRNSEKRKSKYSRNMSEYQPTAYTAAPAPYMSYGGVNVNDRMTRARSDVGGAYYRPLTNGRPEWDKFYDQLATEYRKPHRNSSYRY